jgi:hypothetical protein
VSRPAAVGRDDDELQRHWSKAASRAVDRDEPHAEAGNRALYDLGRQDERASAAPKPGRAEFFEALNAKLDRGERQYGEASFARPAPALVTELEEEALDLAGWGFILWVRLRSLRAATETAEREAER